ncbi:MAG: cytidine deaminase [Clostridia bacterium]|jgi:cytidine deaminase
MCKTDKMFRLAKEVAIKNKDRRKHKLGAIGIRTDGTIVKSNNLENRLPEPQAHAEARVVKKMGFGGVIYVARVLANGDYAIARPCKNCQGAMRLHGIRRCYYTIDNNSHGVMEL